MKKIRDLSLRWPILFGLVVTGILTLANLYLGRLLFWLPGNVGGEMLRIVISMLWPVGLVLLCGYGFTLRGRGFGKTLRVGLGLLAFYAALLAATIFEFAKPETQWVNAPAVALGVLTLIGIGVREECLYRSLVQNAMVCKFATTRKGIWLAVLLSGGIFGAAHFINLFFGVNPLSVSVQAIAAAAMGMLFGAVYLRGGNLWAMVLIHATIDAFALFESLFTENVAALEPLNSITPVSLASVVLLLLVTVFLLRGSKCDEILARADLLRSQLKK